jgi:hypothetical protein
MARPLLIFPSATTVNRLKIRSYPPDWHFPAPEKQKNRLTTQFERLNSAFRQARLEITPSDSPLEKVLVMETVGTVENFMNAVRNIQGLEWLSDWRQEEVTADEDFYDEDNHEKALSGQVYLIMSNQKGMATLLRHWRIYKRNPANPIFRHGQKRWVQLFSHLKDIRFWEAKDRVKETGILEEWQESLSMSDTRNVVTEIELWFRNDPPSREAAEQHVVNLVREIGGTVADKSVIPEIEYHALLVELPATAVEQLRNAPAFDRIKLLACDGIMFFRPSGQAYIPSPMTPSEEIPITEPPPSGIQGKPVVALLDGLPLGNHALLKGRLQIDDPDNWEQNYPAQSRIHGTAMASLIVNGNADSHEKQLMKPLYVRPILQPDSRAWRNPGESVPEHSLTIDLIHRAVRRMFEPENGAEAVAPTIFAINLSVCDRSRMFERFPSPWARLLDYLAWKYKVLFLVSSGNHGDSIDTGLSKRDFAAIKHDPPAIEKLILNKLCSTGSLRRLRSPAESINSLSVGATHEDEAVFSGQDGWVNPFSSDGLPSPINPQGFGFRGSIKPEILIKGGRQIYSEKITGSQSTAILDAVSHTSAPGIRVAMPGVRGTLNSTCYCRGTSNATALATRHIAQIYDTLEALRQIQGEESLPQNLNAVAAKALLVHSASWRISRAAILQHLPSTDDELLARLLGYGAIDGSRIYDCEPQRVTVIGSGLLNSGKAHIYNFPLPPSLSGKVCQRRLTYTLAWFSPINNKSYKYRRAALWAVPEDNSMARHFAELLRVDRSEVEFHMGRRGTVQHVICEGENATAYDDGKALKFAVNCREDGGSFSEPIPYAFVVSLEVAPSVNLPIYDEVQARIRPAVQIRST